MKYIVANRKNLKANSRALFGKEWTKEKVKVIKQL